MSGILVPICGESFLETEEASIPYQRVQSGKDTVELSVEYACCSARYQSCWDPEVFPIPKSKYLKNLFALPFVSRLTAEASYPVRSRSITSFGQRRNCESTNTYAQADRTEMRSQVRGLKLRRRYHAVASVRVPNVESVFTRTRKPDVPKLADLADLAFVCLQLLPCTTKTATVSPFLPSKIV